jgi:hypothetical protein
VTETTALRDSLLSATPVIAERPPAMFQPLIATSHSATPIRLHPPLQIASAFNPLLVSLQI